MNKLLYSLLICSCLFLMACPLQTETPIQPSGMQKAPSWLPGRWTVLSNGALGATSYLVKLDPASGSGLQIYNADAEGKPDESSRRPAVVTSIKGKLFLSVYEEEDDASDAGYYHYALERKGDGDIELIALKEGIVAFSEGSKLGAYLASHSPDEYLNRGEREIYRKRK